MQGVSACCLDAVSPQQARQGDVSPNFRPARKRTVAKYNALRETREQRTTALSLLVLLDKLPLRAILLEMSEFNIDAIQADSRSMDPRISNPGNLAGPQNSRAI